MITPTAKAMITFHNFLFRNEELSLDTSTLTDAQLESIAECLLSPDLLHYKHSLDNIQEGLSLKVLNYNSNSFKIPVSGGDDEVQVVSPYTEVTDEQAASFLGNILLEDKE
jgi:hypothetical protein